MPVNPTRSLSPWWLLLLVPVALPLGWLVGKVDGPSPPVPSRPQVANTAAPSPPAGIEASRSINEPTSSAVPPPAPAPKPREDAPAIVSQWTDLRSAMSESERNGKPILIDFNADWCGPCQRMKRQLFDDGNHGQAVKTAVIPVSIVDRRREEGRNSSEVEDLYRRFQVDAFPTLVVFSPKTGRATTTKGFGGAEATLAWITEAARTVR